jgi:FlaG/FlaF family flagellin (archaellin)
VKFDGKDEARENEVLAAIVAVLLAGAITFVLWAIFGQSS